jgi:hypothetical protein
MAKHVLARAVLASVFVAWSLSLASGARAKDSTTAGQFLAACDELDPSCRNEFVAGLRAVYEGHFACPPRIDVNTPISPWLAYLHRRVRENPALAGGDKNDLQLQAFEHLWPCPKK